MKDSSEGAIYGFVQVLVYRPMNLFLHIKNQTPSGQMLLMYVHAYVLQQVMLRGLQASSLSVTFYDVKPQSVKTPIAAKPSTTLPNHICQRSLVILNYYISPSHFSTADHL